MTKTKWETGKGTWRLVGLKRESWKVKALPFTPVVITEKLVFCVVGRRS